MRRWTNVLILCSLCRREWPSTKAGIRRRKRLECPNCGAIHDTKKMELESENGQYEYYETGADLPERGQA